MCIRPDIQLRNASGQCGIFFFSCGRQNRSIAVCDKAADNRALGCRIELGAGEALRIDGAANRTGKNTVFKDWNGHGIII